MGRKLFMAIAASLMIGGCAGGAQATQQIAETPLQGMTAPLPTVLPTDTPTDAPPSATIEPPAAAATVRQIPEGTPAGVGVLTDKVGDPVEYLTGDFIPLGYAWYEPTEGGFYLVYAGQDARDPSQGVVLVLRSGTIWHPLGSWHPTAEKTGGLLIIDAQGERLILRSMEGATYYFDVAAGRFIGSLTEVAATMTPGPTTTPESPPQGLVQDDAPDEPSQAVVDQPFDQALRFYIEAEGDEDWFVFHLDSEADLQFALIDLPAPYGIEVYLRRNLTKLSSQASPTNADKSILISHAQPGNYLVHVWGLEGAWCAQKPYTIVVSRNG